MSHPPDALPEAASDAPPAAPAPPSPTRPFYWSVRRELWENRSIYLAPLIVAAVMLTGVLVSTISLPRRLQAALAAEAGQQRLVTEGPFAAAAGLMICTAFFVGAFYCLDALHGERRDRSILFWKSLPVSDTTAVLAKACVPLVILPLITLAIVVGAHVITLLVSAAVLQVNGLGAAVLWSRLPLFQTWLALVYALASIALWHAPVYAWLLMVSAWARRAPILWALVPPLALGIFGRLAFNSTYVCRLLATRVMGWGDGGFEGCGTMTPLLSAVAPARFVSSPGLWVGLLLAAAFLTAAIRLRRNRGPI